MVHEDVLKAVEDVRIRQMRGGTIVTHAALMALRSAAVKSTASAGEHISETEESGVLFHHFLSIDRMFG